MSFQAFAKLMQNSHRLRLLRTLPNATLTNRHQSRAEVCENHTL